MSFIEDNKRWLLPAVGIACAMVVVGNFRRARRNPGTTSSGVQGTSPPVSPSIPPAAPPGSSATREGHPLRTPSPALNDIAGLLQAGRNCLGVELLAPPSPPSLHPERWSLLPDVSRRFTDAGPPGPAPAPDFLIDTGDGAMAWIDGQGYRPGETVGNGYWLRQVTPGGIVLAGPQGEVERPLKSALEPPAIPPPGAPAPGAAEGT